MSYFAELYYIIRRQKPLLTHYSIKVLGSNHAFNNTKATKELSFTPRPIYETIKDTLQFAQEHYLINVNGKWKRKQIK